MNAHAIPWKRPRTTQHAPNNSGTGYAFDEDLLCRFCRGYWDTVSGQACVPSPEAMQENKRYAHALASKRARDKASARRRRHRTLAAQTGPG